MTNLLLIAFLSTAQPAPVACTMQADTIAATFVEPISTDATEFGKCDGKQQADCAAKCDAAAPAGHVTVDSKCEHHLTPFIRGYLATYSCSCTWVPLDRKSN